MGPQPLDGGRYSLSEKLGKRARKIVYLARDQSLQRDVAVCMFKEHVVAGSFIDRIQREAATLAALDHPNIIGVCDLRKKDGW